MLHIEHVQPVTVIVAMNSQSPGTRSKSCPLSMTPTTPNGVTIAETSRSAIARFTMNTFWITCSFLWMTTAKITSKLPTKPVNDIRIRKVMYPSKFVIGDVTADVVDANVFSVFVVRPWSVHAVVVWEGFSFSWDSIALSIYVSMSNGNNFCYHVDI